MEGPSCSICARPTYDPAKRERPWARGVAGGGQVLVCPDCQRNHPGWQERLDTCPNCGGTRLSVTLGAVACRACGHVTARA